jgi:hypothetical protein
VITSLKLLSGACKDKEIHSMSKPTPKIYWVLQNNQVTPSLVEFLKLTKQRMKEVSFEVKIPERDKDALKLSKGLNPTAFQVIAHRSEGSLANLIRKRDAIGEAEYSEGLFVWRALLADHLGGEVLIKVSLQIPPDPRVRCVIIQIPSPLGSHGDEEYIYYAWTLWARERGIPVIGYEFLPLDIRWTLAPSLLDGIITTSERSLAHLSSRCGKMPSQIWLLPRFEACSFSPASPLFWRQDLGIAYEYRAYKIPRERAVLYIPHNVMMVYEYQTIMKKLTEIGDKLHIMLATGKSQARGTHTHSQIIEKVCKKELEHFASYSFHDLDLIWDIPTADGLVAASTCYSTCVSSSLGIPTIIYDDVVPAGANGYQKTVNSLSGLMFEIEKLVDSHAKVTELKDIISDVLSWK